MGLFRKDTKLERQDKARDIMAKSGWIKKGNDILFYTNMKFLLTGV